MNRLRHEIFIFVPDNWTGEQALAIHDFLERLTTTIWERYEKEMIPLILVHPYEDQIELFPPDIDDEDVPF